MNTVRLKEKESKYLVEVPNKNVVWIREFIIYQWYDNQKENYESKYKLIFDILNLTHKFVKVEKQRTDAVSSDKTVTYLTIKDFESLDLSGIPFVMKRRSIKEQVHLDYFIYSSGICEYLMEIEDEETDVNSLEDVSIIKEVSTEKAYLNINMAIPFEKKHKEELSLFFKVLQ